MLLCFFVFLLSGFVSPPALAAGCTSIGTTANCYGGGPATWNYAYTSGTASGKYLYNGGGCGHRAVL